ncbi:DUF2922 domain-containing protein [Irregularibacter muris]|uniref:DUF2922 domain-containing protein n=1 Tax=Irregularibacter muris TaxID=1796619 RepID=A0AAE3HD94_9FIRM|nr:DUF2922 domain-containing protein [Irregularibacter muris]MCR1898251.1 DUF2922 domain-containing protein [Irregularibacter muris]
MATLRLEMTFKNTEGRTSKIAVDNARDDLTDIEVKEAMDSILGDNIFITTGGDLVEKSKAELITTEVKEFEIE